MSSVAGSKGGINSKMKLLLISKMENKKKEKKEKKNGISSR